MYKDVYDRIVFGQIHPEGHRHDLGSHGKHSIFTRVHTLTLYLQRYNGWWIPGS